MANTKLSTILATTAVLALTACGGGSSGVPIEIRPERIFSDGGGVASGKTTNGSSFVYIIDDVGEFVDFVQTNNTTGEGLDLNTFGIVQILPTNANVRQGAANNGSLVGNITVVDDLGGRADIRIFEFPNTNIIFATVGDKFVSSPIGSLTYNGTFITGYRDINPLIEYGSFTLNANFTNKTFFINGSNDYDTLSGSGTMNIATGTLSSNTLTMNTSGTGRAASLYGNLHGNNAESVSGMFHSNSASQYYIGAFVGSR